MHTVPADVCVIEDEMSDPEEYLGHAGLQLHAAQRVHAQVQEVQVRDVGNDGADLAKKVQIELGFTDDRLLKLRLRMYLL